jgi:hypothetical protein
MTAKTAAIIAAGIVIAVLGGIWLNNYLSPYERCVREKTAETALWESRQALNGTLQWRRRSVEQLEGFYRTTSVKMGGCLATDR